MANIYKTCKKKQKTTSWFLYISEYQIARSLAFWKGTQSTSYLVNVLIFLLINFQILMPYKTCQKKTTSWFFYMSEYEIFRSLAFWKGTETTSYLVNVLIFLLINYQILMSYKICHNLKQKKTHWTELI